MYLVTLYNVRFLIIKKQVGPNKKTQDTRVGRHHTQQGAGLTVQGGFMPGTRVLG